MILGIQPSNKGAVGCYRLIQPLMKVHDDTENDTHAAILNANINQTQFEALAANIDVYVYQYPQLEPQVKHIEFMSEDPNVLTVVEIDDDVWNIDPKQEQYAYFGLREVKMDGKWLWQDKKGGFDIEANRKRVKNLVRCMMACDLVTVTTPELKNRIETNLKEAKKKKVWVEVLPNCVDLNFYDPVEIVKEKPRIIWHGGNGHRHDFWSVAKALKKILDTYDVELHLAANAWKEVTDFLGDKVKFNPAWTSFDAHPYRLKLMGGDIGICPLEDNDFNRVKSEIKYTEFSALGLPTVASAIPPYSPVVKHGKTGFLAKTEDDWVKHLSALIESKELRKEIGSSARKWVEENRSAAETYNQWVKVYKKYLDIKT